MNKNFDLIKEFAKHINYGLDNFNSKFKPSIYNHKTHKKLELTEYQKFSSSVFLIEDFKNMLLFWETGFGKTIECVYIIENIFKLYPQWKIFIFVKSSLKNDPWEKSLDMYISDNIKQHIIFIHYDAQNTENLFLLKHESIKPGERILYVFDEVHDFIKKLLPKENNPERRLTKIIKPLLEDFNKPLNKVLFMSATPINDNFLEFNYLLHFLRNGNLKLSQQLFTKDNILIEPSLLKKTCLGLVSFQRRSEIDVFKNVSITESLAGKKIKFVELTMSNTQTSMYKIISQIELNSKSRGFRILRKLVNTFAYYDIKIKKNMDEEEYKKLLTERFDAFYTQMKNISFSTSFLDDFKNETLEIFEDTAMAKNLNFITNDKLKFSSTLDITNPESKNKDLENLRLLHSYSSKYVKTCQIVKQARGKCLIYQPFVTFEGVRTLLTYMDKFDISYIEYTQKTKNTRTELIKKFNEKSNVYGKTIKSCVLSSAGTEGISLLNISDLIIMDLPWSGSALEQIFGRAIRLNSHIDLPIEERYVNIHILINKTNSEPSLSVDKELLDLIKRKEKQKCQLSELLANASLESIHNQYPDVESVENTNFYPLINNKYDLEQVKKYHISVLKELIPIYYTFDITFNNYTKGMLDESLNYVYYNTELIGTLVFNENGRKIFTIINNNLVYLIKNIE